MAPGCGLPAPTRSYTPVQRRRGGEGGRANEDAARLDPQRRLRRAHVNGRFVDADPYPWPYDGTLRPDTTALVVIDMQTDFCGSRAVTSTTMGYDLSLTRAPIEPIKALMAVDAGRRLRDHPHARGAPAGPQRPAGEQAVALAARGCRHRRPRAVRPGSGAAASPAGRSFPSWRPFLAEIVIDKPGKGSFCATDLELILRMRGIRNLVLTGITTDVCVHTTMREANDRGFECLIVADCCAATDAGNHAAALRW